MGYAWANNTEISVQEAIAYILQLPFRMSSRSFVYVNSLPMEKRVGVLKTNDILKNLPQN